MYNNIKYATIRDVDDQLHIEGRFDNGEKFMVITIDKKWTLAERFAELAVQIIDNSQDKKHV